MSVDRLSENLRGKVAIVTGAASGIGLAITRQLNEYGVSVVAEDINPGVDDLFGSQFLERAFHALIAVVGDIHFELVRIFHAKQPADHGHFRRVTRLYGA